MPSIDTRQRIKEQVTGHAVVLYMKGTPQFPQCGFSALAVQVLNACGVHDFHTVDVLADGSESGVSAPQVAMQQRGPRAMFFQNEIQRVDLQVESVALGEFELRQ